MNSERRDYLAAFAIGAIVGAGIAMLLAPVRKHKRKHRRLHPAATRLRKRASRLRRVMHARH
jgi:gas vesicle protein